MDLFNLQGKWSTHPYTGNPSGQPDLETPIEEQVSLTNKLLSEYALTSDSPVDVALAGLTAVNLLIIKTVGGKVRVRLTSTDGTDQAMAVDSFLLLISDTVPYTAIDLTRLAGVDINVTVFLGQRA